MRPKTSATMSWMRCDARWAGGGATGRRAAVELGEHLVGQRPIDRGVGQRRVGDDADQRGLEAAQVVGDALGDQLQDAVVADVDPVVVGALAQHRQPRGGVGRADVDQQPGLEALAQAVLELGHVARRAVGGQHQLAARLVQRVEGVEELLLGLHLALEELHVVDQQDVVAPVAVLEGVDVAGLQRLEELVGEALDRRVADGQPATVGADVVADAVQQVGLADAGRADDEERVVGLAGQLGDRERRGVGEAVGVADDELLEGELGVQARGLALGEERGARVVGDGRRRGQAVRRRVSSSRRRRGAPRARRCRRRGWSAPRRRGSPRSAAAPTRAPRTGRAGRSDRRRCRPSAAARARCRTRTPAPGVAPPPAGGSRWGRGPASRQGGAAP